jgi:hypothetical protein
MRLFEPRPNHEAMTEMVVLMLKNGRDPRTGHALKLRVISRKIRPVLGIRARGDSDLGVESLTPNTAWKALKLVRKLLPREMSENEELWMTAVICAVALFPNSLDIIGAEKAFGSYLKRDEMFNFLNLLATKYRTARLRKEEVIYL